VSGLGFFGADIPGYDLATVNANSDLNCAIACDNSAACVAWSWDNSGSGTCWLKSGVNTRVAASNRVFGVKLGQNVDRVGGDMPGMPLNLGSATPSACAAQCQSTQGCVAWSFDSCGKSSCWLKNTIPTSSASSSCRISAVQGTYNVDHPGADLKTVELSPSATTTDCNAQCLSTAGCTSWAMVQPGVGCELTNTCWLKSSATQATTTNNCRVSGVFGASGTGSSSTTGSGSSSGGGSSDPTVNNFINAHNAARSAVHQSGLSWDTNLANQAATYARKCTFAHSGTSGVGENIFANAPGSTDTASLATSAVQSWVGEKSSFNCQANTCNSGAVCGHYTQVIWGSTTAVGCGVVKCTTNSPFGSSFPTWNFVVCQYTPPGNWVGQSPIPANSC